MKGLLTVAIIAAALALASCGGRVHKAPANGAISLEPKAYTLSDALAELDALVKPEGVDAKLWDELKGALREALLVEGRGFIPRRNSPESGRRGVKHPPFSPDSGNQNPEPGWPARRTLKLVSSPPTGAANKVNDLTATREVNGDFTLSWHYRNLGDYDQNGVVGVSDITPLAMRFGETYDKEAESNSIQAVIDGSGSGKVDVADVTQIAQYFGCEFAQYAIQGGDQQQGPFAQTNTAQLPAEGRSDARLAFAFSLGSQPPYTYWRVVPMDGAGNPGDASNVATLNVEAAVRVLGVTPLQGLAGANVTFTAFVAGTGPFAYEWDFGGGATPNVSTAAQPLVALNSDTADTQYAAQVKVTGATGSATRNFTLTVTTSPGNPPVINSVGPLSGLSGEQLNFSADVTGDGPLAYSWEFDGGASPPVSADANPTAILSRGGTLPAPNKDYPCRLTVTNDSGAASANFTLTVSAQWHVEDLPYVPYRTKGTIASARFSEDGVLCGVSWYYIEASGTMVIAFLRYIGGQWDVEPAATGNFVPYFSGMNLCFTSAGRPVIAWGDASDGAVHITRETGGEWRHEVVAPGGAFWPIIKLMLDSQDRAVIAFSYPTGVGYEGAYKIARQNGGGWDIFDYPIARPSEQVTLGPDDLVHVVNNAENELQARLFIETNGGWDSHLIIESPEGGIAYPMSLSIDASGLAHMIVGGAELGILVSREKPGFTFEFDPIDSPIEGVTFSSWLYLTPQLGEVVFFSPDNYADRAALSWKSGDTWQYTQSPIPGERDFIHFLMHPSGYPVIESGMQMAGYW